MELLTRVNVRQCLDVQIGVYELLNGLINIFDLKYVFYPPYGWYWELRKTNEGKDVLKRYDNCLLDGIPQVNKVISEENTIKAYKCIKELKELIDEEVKNETDY